MRRFMAVALLVACGREPAPDTPPAPSSAPAPSSSATVVDDRRATLEATLRRLVGPTLTERPTRAVGIVIVEQDASRVFAFGRKNVRDARPPSGTTTFEIGSISKGFAGILLADAVLRGELALSDPVRQYLPGDVVLRFDPTLEHLGSLSAGFPLMPDNWVTVDPVAHTTRYTLRDFRAFLRKFAPASPPGERYSYSNVDTALLAMALSARRGTTYAALVRERLFEPLAMKRSAYAARPYEDADRLDGYDDAGQLRPVRGDVSPLGPCCAIRTTLDDMSRFMRGVMPSTRSPLSRAFELASRPRLALDSSHDQFVGLGWIVQPRYGSVAKNGQVEGYRSVLTLYPDTRRGVLVVVNSETVDVDTLSTTIIETLFHPRPKHVGEHSEHVVERLAPSATPASFEFDRAIRLEGWSAPACVEPGATARIVYYHRTLRELGRDWKIFVHGDAAKTGVARLHGDHYPAGGRDTTLDWKRNELVADEFELVVPKSYAADAFTIWTGWYRGNVRMSATSQTHEVADNRARGPTISVGECSQ